MSLHSLNSRQTRTFYAHESNKSRNEGSETRSASGDHRRSNSAAKREAPPTAQDALRSETLKKLKLKKVLGNRGKLIDAI
jgi:hypothetical protein